MKGRFFITAIKTELISALVLLGCSKDEEEPIPQKQSHSYSIVVQIETDDPDKKPKGEGYFVAQGDTAFHTISNSKFTHKYSVTDVAI